MQGHTKRSFARPCIFRRDDWPTDPRKHSLRLLIFFVGQDFKVIFPPIAKATITKMMGSNVLLRRGLSAGGGAVAVTLAGWCGEHTASRTSSRVVSRAGNHLLQQPSKKAFTSSTAAAKPAEAATATAVPPPASPSFVQWYESHLDARPIVTKSITGSILWGVGDCVAQLVPQVAFEQPEGKTTEGLTYDWARTGRAVAFGGILHAPTSHLHFNFLEWMTVRTGVSGLGIPIFKTIMEQVREIESGGIL